MAINSYRVVGVRADGSRRVLADDLPEKIAIQIRDQVGDGIFASVVVEQYEPDVPDSPDEQAELTDRKSALLFPPRVQPPDETKA
jgi:hypothetical protein